MRSCCLLCQTTAPHVTIIHLRSCCPLPSVELLGLLLQAVGLKGGQAPERHVEHTLCLLLAQAELLLQRFRGSSTCTTQSGRGRLAELVGAQAQEHQVSDEQLHGASAAASCP